MTVYSYSAVDDSGRRAEGTVASADRQEALHRLLAQGLSVLDLRQQAAGAQPSTVGQLLRRRKFRLAVLTRQLATLYGSGVPLVRSMNVLIEQAGDPRTRTIFRDILQSVEAGRSLAQALAQHPDVFPPIMVSMVRVGQMSGTLEEVLNRLAELFEKQDEVRGEVRAALAYPALVLVMGVASAAVLALFVIPRLELMFEGMGQRLPLPTRILLAISGAVSANWLVLLVGLLAAIVALRLAVRNERFRLRWDALKLRIPWAGQLMRQAAIARFARSLGTLVHADVSIVTALEVV